MFEPYHLSRRTRIAIMLTLVASFFVISPVLILYTAGYRYTVETHTISTTGVLSIDVEPDDAAVYINDELVEKNLPLIQRATRLLQGKSVREKAVLPLRLTDLTPGVYRIHIQKDGYKSWTKDVTIESNKTAYIKNIELFLESVPIQTYETKAQAAFSPSGKYVVLLNENTASLSTVADPTTSLFTSQEGELPQRILWSPYAEFFVLESTINTIPHIILVSAGTPESAHQYRLTDVPTHIQWISESIPSIVVQQGPLLERMTLVGRAPLDTTSTSVWYVQNNETIWYFDTIAQTLQQEGKTINTPLHVKRNIDAIIDSNNERIIAHSLDSLLSISTNDKEGNNIKQVPATSLFYNAATKEWIAWSPWELWTLYPHGGADLRNRTSEAIQFVRPLDSEGVLLIATEKKLLAFNPNPLYYTTHELFSGSSLIEEVSVDIDKRIISMLTTIDGSRGIYALPY